MDNLLNLVRDLAVVGYIFILRIGVVVWLTLMLGWWLRKLLEEKEEAPDSTPAETTQHTVTPS